MQLNIEELARQANIDPHDMCEDPRIAVHSLEQFAQLVAAAVKEEAAKRCDEAAERSERSAIAARSIRDTDIYRAAANRAMWLAGAIRAMEISTDPNGKPNR